MSAQHRICRKDLHAKMNVKCDNQNDNSIISVIVN